MLSDRHTVIDFLRSPPLLPSILSEDKTLISYPEFFRSIQRHLIDCSLGEFAFEVLFFDPEDTKMLIEVIGAACEELHLTTVNWVRGSFDVVGVMILCILLQAAVEELAKEGVPILQEFFLKWGLEREGLNVVCGPKACRDSKSSWRCRSRWGSAVAVRRSR